MSFPPNKLSPLLKNKLERFLDEENLIDLYQRYEWREKDNYANGFNEILNLELSISKAAKENSLNQTHLKKIAKWGVLRDSENIYCINEPLDLPLYDGDNPAEWIQRKPEGAIHKITPQIIGFGPTYLSKLLRFALPSEYGVIDTQLVRVFGIGILHLKKCS